MPGARAPIKLPRAGDSVARRRDLYYVEDVRDRFALLEECMSGRLISVPLKILARMRIVPLSH